MNSPVSICWFRNDLRTKDNPALLAAAKRGVVVPVFIWSPAEEGRAADGAAGRWWRHQSLKSLQAELAELGSQLIIRQGQSFDELEALANQTGADAVFWNRRIEPAVARRDAHIQSVLTERGIQAESFNAALLYEPADVRTQQGRPFQVFTPFWKACCRVGDPPKPSPRPRKLPKPPDWPKSEPLESLGLEPTINWTTGMQHAWQPGTAGAATQLQQFLRRSILDYQQARDLPEHAGTSRLSPHLHFGEIGPRQVWHAVKNKCNLEPEAAESSSVETYLLELGWREFAHHVLFHFPETADRPLREKFDSFPWRDDQTFVRAWQRGLTGYPIVDAGMRELWATGWMHNRVRMIVGSFLTKDLLQSWRVGAEWFSDMLVDADLANNTLGWQWVSGCGADAAPFFRIFNPTSQGKKFDSNGGYVRRWVPELANLPTRWIHQPWEATEQTLRDAGIKLGTTYPRPIVDHAVARQTALDAFAEIKNQ